MTWRLFGTTLGLLLLIAAALLGVLKASRRTPVALRRIGAAATIGTQAATDDRRLVAPDRTARAAFAMDAELSVETPPYGDEVFPEEKALVEAQRARSEQRITSLRARWATEAVSDAPRLAALQEEIVANFGRRQPDGMADAPAVAVDCRTTLCRVVVPTTHLGTLRALEEPVATHEAAVIVVPSSAPGTMELMLDLGPQTDSDPYGGV